MCLKAIKEIHNVKIGDICLYAALLIPKYQMKEKINNQYEKQKIFVRNLPESATKESTQELF